MTSGANLNFDLTRHHKPHQGKLPPSQTVPHLKQQVSHHNHHHLHRPTSRTNVPNGATHVPSHGLHPIFAAPTSSSFNDISRVGGFSAHGSVHLLPNGSSPPPPSPFTVSPRARKKELGLSFAPSGNANSHHATPTRRPIAVSDSTATTHGYNNYLRYFFFRAEVPLMAKFVPLLRGLRFSRELERTKNEIRQSNKQQSSNKQRAKSVEAVRLLERAGSTNSSGGDSFTSSGSFGVALTINVNGSSHNPTGRFQSDLKDNPCSEFTSPSSDLGVLKIAGCKYRAKKSDITFEEPLGWYRNLNGQLLAHGCDC